MSDEKIGQYSKTFEAISYYIFNLFLAFLASSQNKILRKKILKTIKMIIYIKTNQFPVIVNLIQSWVQCVDL